MENSKDNINEIKDRLVKAFQEFSKDYIFAPSLDDKKIVTLGLEELKGVLSKEVYNNFILWLMIYDLELYKIERDYYLMSDMNDTVPKEKVRKVFISQPFKGRTDEMIESEIARIKEVLSKFVCGEFEILPSFQPMPEGKNNLWCLGRSLQYLSEADIVFFSSDYLECYLNSKGCMIENICNMIYNKDVITIYECSLRQYLYNIKQFEDFIDLDEEEFATNMSVINYDCGGKEYVIVRRINSEKII